MIDVLQPLDTLTIWSSYLQMGDYANATVRRYGSAVRGFLLWGEKQERRPINFRDLTPIILMGYRRNLQQRRTTATTNLHVSALRAWCQWLTEEGYLDENPASRLKTIGHIKPDAPVPLTDSEVNALLRSAQRSRYDKRNYAICQMLLQTGMRLGECQALAWGDIFYKERKGTVFIRAGKGNKARSIPLNGSVRSALAEYASPILDCEATTKAVAANWGQIPQQQPLWTSQKGKILSASALWRMFVSLVADCVTRDLMPESTTPHDLRHTFAHRYLAQHPGDLIGLARILGHESLETTKVYLRLSANDLTARMEAMDINAYKS